MQWPLDPMTLMWIQVATGFLGAMTLTFLVRLASKKLGLGQGIQTYFSPSGGARDALLRVLNRARREVLVQAYSFPDETLLNALVEAKKRGATVEVILDPHHEKVRTDDFHFLLAQGIDPLLDVEAKANPQVVLVDGNVLVTGSYDYTPQAEGEYSQHLLIHRGHPDLARQFRDNFFKHKAHSKPAHKKEEEKLRLAA